MGKPAKLSLESVVEESGTVNVRARVADRNGVPCLDAREFVRFDVIGDAKLLDNLGTSTGARKVQLCNGRASISALITGPAVVSISSDGLPTAFLNANRTRR